MAAPAPPEDQVRLLSDALEAVRHQTGLMRKCLDMPGKLMDALKCWYVVSPVYPHPRALPPLSRHPELRSGRWTALLDLD